MDLGNDRLKLTIDDRTGALTSLINDRGKQFIHRGSGTRPLFALSFIDAAGAKVVFDANDATSCTVGLERRDGEQIATMRYHSLRGLPIHVEATVRCSRDQAMTAWTCAVEHDTDWRLDWIDFPDVVVPNDLIGAGGDGRILWPGFEGVLVDDIAYRESKGMIRYEPLAYPSNGWTGGMYPGAVPSQMMAYYGASGGLYVAAHDPHGGIKGIEFRSHDGGIRLEYRMYVGAAARGRYQLPFDMVLGVFAGDWHDAAAIHREWFQASAAVKPPKLPDNPRVPAWLADSPVVVTYPVRGTQDTGDMSVNEFFPFTNALPHLARLREAFDSPVMSLLMQWEGTAPWAPPYVWPPLDEADLRQFVDQLHERGDYAGLYCSGIGWTQKSKLTPEYDRSADFERLGLAKHMCVAPDGSLPLSRICDFVRSGYDLCPAADFTRETVAAETAKMLDAKVDYIQFFDQNEGGMACLCYAKDHGHPPGPGAWQVEANRAIHHQIESQIAAGSRTTLIGCEGAAADTYLSTLMFNDARFEVMYSLGTPVPLYGYLYHEYTFNFMGNQCCSHWIIDYERSPANLLQRIAHAFLSGDALTAVLKGGGQVHWAWGTPWAVEAPEQAPVIAFIRNLNAWRRHRGKPYLYGGRMLKPHPLRGVGNCPIVRKDGTAIDVPSLLGSRWRSADGAREGQFVINYDSQALTASIVAGDRPARLVADPSSGAITDLLPHAGAIRVEVPPWSAVLVEW